MLNLFIAVIVSAMQTVSDAEQADTVKAIEHATEHIESDLHAEMRALRSEIQSLRERLEVPLAPPRP